MADILDGLTDHSQWAPLSTGQSLAIAKHLQDQIRRLQGAVEDIQQDLQQANRTSSGLREQLGHTNGALHLLQEGLTGLNAVVDTTRKDLGRSHSSVQRLQASLGDSNEAIVSLREGQKVGNTNLQKVDAELGKNTGLTMRLQESIEKRLVPDVALLWDELSKTNLGLQNLRAESQQTRLFLQEERDGLRAANVATQGVRDDLLKTNTVVHLIEQRLAHVTNDTRLNRQSCDDLGVSTHRLREDLENTKGHLAVCQTGLKRTTCVVKTASEELDRTQKALAGTQGKLETTVGSLDNARQTLEKVNSHVRSLGEGSGRSDEQMNRLQQEVQEVAQLARQVEAGLNTTNSLVLPNLHKQGKSGGGFPGMESMNETLKSPRTPSRQEKRHSNNKKVHQLNGTVPQNRMAWA